MVNYLGGKISVANYISEAMLKFLKENDVSYSSYCEPFLGMGSVFAIMSKSIPTGTELLGSDISHDITLMWRHILRVHHGEIEKFTTKELDVTKEEHKEILKGKPCARRTIVGGCYGYMGKLFGSYNSGTNTRKRNAVKQYDTQLQKTASMEQMKLYEGSYAMYTGIKGCVFYCDPPYKNTAQEFFKQYDNSIRRKGKLDTFDSEAFWSWCQKMADNGNIVFVSERCCPMDNENIKQIWQWKDGKKEKLYVVLPRKK
jgi:site-specific DNA-adenine methylase